MAANRLANKKESFGSPFFVVWFYANLKVEDFVEKASVSRKDVYLCGRNQEKKRHVYRIRIKAIYR
jgi:hypothetical protein